MTQFSVQSDEFLNNNRSIYEVMMDADNNGNLISQQNPMNVRLGDSPSASAFGRLRAANTRLLGEFRNQYGTMGPVEIVTKFEVGGTQTINLYRI